MKTSRLIAVSLLVVFCAAMLAGFAFAEDKISIKGKIRDYNIDNKTVEITTNDGKDMTFVIENEKALKKLDDRLFRDDEVKIRYIIKDGKNIIKDNNDFKGTKPGC
ncbi:MAG TPA: hypothetical protein VI728_00790 [Syntrophales bacterium]|nr:hypothetical protein [Syntrophales bacterium]